MLKTLVAAVALTAPATLAMAHVSLEQQQAQAGATTKITLRVPHGCDGQATETVRITLPDGFYAAKPMPKAGWELSTVTGAYATPYMNHGHEMTEGVREITWSGGHLEDAWYDEFTLRGAVGPEVAPGTVLYFPSFQVCADGEADWTDTSGSHEVPNPAPRLTVVAGGAHGEHAHDAGAGAGAGQMDMVMPAQIRQGDLIIAAPFARATLPNQPVGGGFMSVENTGAVDDRLIGATAGDVADHVEVHEMAMDGDVMRMRELSDGLPLPAGEVVTLKPGSYHIMFMGLKQGLTEGESFPVTLEFEKAGTVTVTFPVLARDAKSGAGEMQGHMK